MSKGHLFTNMASQAGKLLIDRIVRETALSKQRAELAAAASVSKPSPSPAKAAAPKAAARFQADPGAVATIPDRWLQLGETAVQLGRADDDAGRLAVARLCASGRVRSGRVPSGADRPQLSEWRVSQSGLSDFIGRGAVGWPGPRIGPNGWIFTSDDAARDCEAWLAAVRNAMTAAAPSDDELRRQAAEADALEIQMQPSKIASVFSLPTFRPWKMPNAVPPEFASGFFAWLGVETRRALYQIIQRAGIGDEARRLFVSREEFARLTALAHAEIVRREISQTRMLRIVPPNGGWPRDVPVKLLLAVGSYVPAAPALAALVL